MTRLLKVSTVIVLSTSILVACGGGGYSGTSADTTPPVAALISPVNDAANVDPGSAITATFSETVTGVDATTFILKDAISNSVDGAAVFSRLTATFTPSVPLACSTTYTATLTAGIKDFAGNPLATTSWSFTTRDVAFWAFVDGNGADGINKNTANSAASPHLTVLGSIVYATWQELNGTQGQIRVAVGQ